MDLEEVIKERRSIRRFSQEKIDSQVIEKIIEAGTFAPSHCNSQGWKFIVVDDPEVKEKIIKAGGSLVVKNAPYGILLTYNTALSDNLEYHDWIQSAAAAMQNMLLAIHNLKLGGCWICHLPRKKQLKKIFNIKGADSPIAYLAFGQPQSQQSITIPRKYQLADILSYNTFRWPAASITLKVRLKRILRKTYFLLPTSLKGKLYPLVDKFVKKFHN